MIQSLAIVIAVPIFTMGFNSSLIIGIVLILTVLAIFIVTQAQGIILERISLGALIIALGMLVDNATVVVQAMMINVQRGMSRIKAAGAIVGQTIWPLFGATVIATLAFAAIGASDDSAGEFSRSLYSMILYSIGLSCNAVHLARQPDEIPPCPPLAKGGWGDLLKSSRHW